MIYGYARVSTRGQQKNGNSLEDQRNQLKKNGCEVIVDEQYTGSTVDRPKFDKLLSVLKWGDILVVTKLDRFARNVEEGINVISRLFKKNVKVYVLNVGLLENSPMGNFFIATLLAVAELERSMIAERMQSGKAIARTKSGFREGRPPVAKERIEAALILLEHHSYRQVEKMTGISKSTLARAKRRRLATDCGNL
ncbi:MAG: recombinase family protein [Veillonellales bacterium]